MFRIWNGSDGCRAYEMHVRDWKFEPPDDTKNVKYVFRPYGRVLLQNTFSAGCFGDCDSCN